ncbi:MAG TPA: hypothetical protein VG538_05910 [Vicinamibacterales bacterium]|nr:hypothetical protein [Vicinamibacterales bacterium]
MTAAYAIRAHGFAWPFERDASRDLYWWSRNIPTCETCGGELTGWHPEGVPLTDGHVVCEGCARAYRVEDAA